MSQSALERVMYTSTSVAGADPVTTLHEIVVTADRNNLRDGITGALVIGSGSYLQVLEGAPDDLNRTLERIECDTRHTDLRMLDRRPIDHRSFTAWGMIGAALKPKRGIVMEELIAFASVDPDYVIDRIQTMLPERQST